MGMNLAFARYACVAWLTVGASLASGQDAAPQAIPADEISELQAGLEQAGRQDDSPVAVRREFRNLVRKGLGLVDAAPSAPNRFLVLAAVLECQKRLVAADNSEPNRAALFDICAKLALAPDEYAKERIEADLLLSEKALSEQNATMSERAQALDELIKRYQDTSGETKSLMLGALIVQKLDAPELEEAILVSLDERYSSDPEVIEFRRKHLRVNRLDLTFSGTHARGDGKVFSFPVDVMGRMSLMVFWSKDKPGLIDILAKINQEAALYPGQIDVFSFNVDELPDGGESVLRQQGLAWTVMRLPEGRQNPAYRSYAQGDLSTVLVNEYGLAVIRTDPGQVGDGKLDSHRISEVRYSAHLQSMFIGDLLLPEAGNGPVDRLGPIEGDLAREIQECFVVAPLRYRLTREAALANYRKAEGLCREASLKNADAPEVWQLRIRRVIALLGIWNLALDPDALDKAVEESKAVLAGKLPVGAQVVPRFALAKAALRQNPENAGSLVADFLKECGGGTNAQALAAAVILAMDARSREHYDQYREQFLSLHGANPAHYAFAAFLGDRHLQYRALKANHSRRERFSRSCIVSYPAQLVRPLPPIELRKLDGSVFALPEAARGKVTYLMFVEPPAERGTNFPELLNRSGKPSREDRVRTMMDYVTGFTSNNVNGDIQVIAAFLTEDADQVKWLVETNGWTCTPVLVPGGGKSPLVRQLGVFSADSMPNVFVLSRDGHVIWQISGYNFQTEFGYPYAAKMAMRIHVEASEFALACKTLEAGNYREALRLFPGPFQTEELYWADWRAPRYHGQALALMGLKDWGSALDAIGKAISAHKLLHVDERRRRSRNWEEEAAKVIVKDPCDVVQNLWLTQALILERLDRAAEAGEVRKLARGPVKADTPRLHQLSHQRLAAIAEVINKEKLP